MTNAYAADARAGEALWRALRLFNVYRILIAGLFLVVATSPSIEAVGEHRPMLFVAVDAAYLLFSLVLALASHYRRPSLETQAYSQALVDISAIVLLMHASGGVTSGLGMLLIVAIAGVSLVMPGRTALFFAALGTLALLGAEVQGELNHTYETTAYGHTGLLGAALFATAFAAAQLGQRARHSEALAKRRGIDLADMAELNGHIVERMHSGIMVVDEQGRVRLINQAARALLGHPQSAGAGSLREISPALHRLFLRWLPVQSTGFQTHRLSEGQGASLQARFTRVGRRKEDHGCVIYLDDTAEITRQIQETKLASLGRVTASIAHEIRNPLGAMTHAAQLLEEAQGLAAEDRRMLGIIREHSRRMNAIINDVLSLSRKQQPSPEPIALEPWLRAFHTELSRDHALDAGWVSIEVEPADTAVYMDPNQLRQVLWNLCYNAMRYGRDPHGNACLVLRGGIDPASHAPFLEVVDRGPGIAPEARERLFEPFFTTSVSGTGLGLFIARQVCENNGGDLSYSAAPDGGSCFRIQFPVSHKQIQEHQVAAGADR